MDSTEYANRWNLAKHLHINFLGPVQPNGWPSIHERLFSDVQKLGRRGFDEFMESITIDTLEKPWRNATRNRAVRLSKLAEECFWGRRNESTWRFTIENEIMHRFSVEVAWYEIPLRMLTSDSKYISNEFSVSNAAKDFGSPRFLQQQTLATHRWSHWKLDVANVSLANA